MKKTKKKKRRGGGGKRVQGWTKTSGNRWNFLVRRVNRMNTQYQALWTSRINLTEVIKSRESISPTNCSLLLHFCTTNNQKTISFTLFPTLLAEFICAIIFDFLTIKKAVPTLKIHSLLHQSYLFTEILFVSFT